MSALLSAQDASDTKALRRAAGEWLRSMREKCGYSQTELAEAVGIEYYSFVSQIENGRGKIPPTRYKQWAAAFKIPAREFTYNIMQYYDPVTFDLLFNEEEKTVHSI